jgi:hypothetical protein
LDGSPIAADLAQLSSAGKLVVATNSDHDIHRYEPDLVADEIRHVVAAARPKRRPSKR